MFEIFWDLSQQRISTQTESSVVKHSANKALDALNTVEARLDKLTLVNMALWSLIKEKTGLTEEELLKRVKEIDLSDGKLDGKARVQAKHCSQCDRVMSIKHKRCLYCGFELPQEDDNAFDDLTAP